MSSLIVKVCRVEAVEPHANADRLAIVKVSGWQCVVERDSWHVGDLCVFFPPDTLLPVKWTDLFHVTNYCSVTQSDPTKARIRCAKLRGEPSFGLVVQPPAGLDDWQVGQDVAGYYGAEKYEPPVKLTAGDAEADHPLFHKYTEVENLRNFPDVLTPGEPVVVSEKLNGCLAYNVRIGMADGSMKDIMRVLPGESVLGQDETGHVVPTQVLATKHDSKPEKWLTVKGKRTGAGRGNHFWAVHCTPNHEFWSPSRGDYIAAESLQAGDKVLLIRNELGLTPVQKQVMLGKLLGDGCLHDTPTGAAVEWGQKADHAAYLDWMERALGDMASGWRDTQTSGYGTTMLRSRTVFNPHIKLTFQDFTTQKVPGWVADKMMPLALAFWYMDDGSLGHNGEQEDRATISTGDFSEPDCRVLLAGLARLGIHAVYFDSDGYSALRFNSDDAERLFLLIAPYVPPVMQYKLPARYRGHPGWLPNLQNQYKPMLVEQTVDEVYENPSIESGRWDIETETHNFFANGILVHNSNCRVGLIDGERMAGSRQLRRKPSPDGVYWMPWGLPPVAELLVNLGLSHRAVILYGEIYGPGVQGRNATYGEKQKAFRAFDLSVDGRYLDYDEMCEACNVYRVPMVPRVGYGPYSFEWVKELSRGKAFQGEHRREGVVIKPIHDREDPAMGRVVLKLINDDVLLDLKREDHTDQ